MCICIYLYLYLSLSLYVYIYTYLFIHIIIYNIMHTYLHLAGLKQGRHRRRPGEELGRCGGGSD